MSTSPELTAGAGFTFEDSVSSMYLASLLVEGTSYGLGGRIVQRVSLQQAPDEPLDDLVVDAQSPSGETARLSLQVKRSLTISAAKSNTDFREVVANSWKTLKKDSFIQGIDRYGAVTGSVTESKFRDLNTICEWARSSDSDKSFITRFGEKGHASAEHKTIKDAVATLLTEAIGNEPAANDLYEFFRHFLCIRTDSLHEGATTPTEQINLLAGTLHESDKER